MTAWNKYNIEVNDWDSLMKIKFNENIGTEGRYCDVGACNGVITSFFKSLAGDKGMVYAFELNPFNYSVVKGYESNNCIVENLAVSDNSDIVEIYGDNQQSGNHVSNMIGHDTAFRKMNIIGEVSSVTLDEYFIDKDLDYLKIDVEGAELKVIKGGVNTIKKCKYVIVECHFETDWKEIYELLKSNNLDFRNLVDDVPVYYGETTPVSGIGKNGMPYQMYLKNS
jgi:FkbM family methyltransferase